MSPTSPVVPVLAGEGGTGTTAPQALSFFVSGDPVPQGSKRHVGHGVVVESAAKTLRPWRDSITWHAIAALQGKPGWPHGVALYCELWFSFARPKSHYRTGRNADELRSDAPTFVTRAPDADKLARACCDALTVARVWHDDAQVAQLQVVKEYQPSWSSRPGVLITVKVAS